MTSNGDRSGVNKRRLHTMAKAFDHEGYDEGINVGEACNVGGDIVRNGNAPGMVDAFVLLPRAGRADGQYALAERVGGDAGADAVDDTNTFKAEDKVAAEAVVGVDQHTHHHFPGTEFPKFGHATDHHGVDETGCFSNSSKHAFSSV